MGRRWSDEVMWLDWDQAVTAIVSQPFRLWWTAGEGKALSIQVGAVAALTVMTPSSAPAPRSLRMSDLGRE
jgi:hypothetical protein